jgi:hypothetical protein
MTTKSKSVFIIRLTEAALMVDDILVINQSGLWITPSGQNLGDHRIMAIFNFINSERNSKELSATIAVRSLLNKLNIPYQIS